MGEQYEAARRLVQLLKQQNKTVTTAESLTGGSVAATITAVPGASAVMEFGFVTYSERAKAAMVRVSPCVIEACNVVSDPVARDMAFGALDASDADLALALTGLAGPDGGTPERPVGTVYICAAMGNTAYVYHAQFGNPGRGQVRSLAVQKVLEMGCCLLEGQPPQDARRADRAEQNRIP